MKTIICIFSIFLALNCFNIKTEVNYQQHLTNIASEINSQNLTWQANENIQHWKQGSGEEFKKLNGLKLTKSPLKEKLPLVTDEAVDIPANFDSRQQWDKCESIKEIRDQANCGSCWAFASSEAFTDRWCIASGQKDQTRMSSQQMLTCCDYCGNGCGGGWDDVAWNYIQGFGLVSGNLYGQDQYCQSYSFAPCDHHVKGPLGPCPPVIQQPSCSYECNAKFQGSFGSDRHYTKTSGRIEHNVAAMQTEIMTNGPVEGSFTVYEDFYTYQSGVYQHKTGEFHGGHAIKIIGWGVDNGTPYWLCSNSWNTSWGEKGFFKILRGVNECGIEDSVTFGLPDINRK